MIDQLRSLPESWTVGQIKHAGDITLGKMLQSSTKGDGDTELPYMRAANVQPDGVLKVDDVKSMWFSERESSQLTLKRGDVVVVEGGIGGFGRAAFVDRDLDAWGFQNSINRIRPYAECDGRFIAYYLIAARYSGFIEAYCNIVSMPHLTVDKLESMPCPLPPLDQQQAIADYLDRETAKIDSLIEKQERLIATLRERAAAVRERALLSFAWDIPLRTVTDLIQTGPFGSQLQADEYVENGTPVINPSHLIAGRVVPDLGVSVDAQKAASLARHTLKVGDLIVARRGELGRAAIVAPIVAGALCGTGSAIIRVSVERVAPDFLALVFGSRRNREALSLASVGSTMDNLNAPILASLRVPCPPLNQQAECTARVTEQTRAIENTATRTERLIALSRERRAALITAAVTGQINVPGAA